MSDDKRKQDSLVDSLIKFYTQCSEIESILGRDIRVDELNSVKTMIKQGMNPEQIADMLND
jgi:hypothetical protein